MNCKKVLSLFKIKKILIINKMIIKILLKIYKFTKIWFIQIFYVKKWRYINKL